MCFFFLATVYLALILLCDPGFFDSFQRTAELKKKSTKPRRPSIKSLFEDESAEAASQSVQGNFLNPLPPRGPKLESPWQLGKSK
uniref:Serine/threonine-protein kinase 38-like n=1 Tax=Rhizophora mucronata TaxID=61149 RepID=A0A2P2MJP7_RHIMU